MSNEKIIGVIVPVHNAEDTLDRCVESIVNQTYRNLKIVLVENGSEDNTLQKCHEWAKRDGRITVLISDKGVSKARNKGLDGVGNVDYLAFVDADDYVDVTMYEKLLKKSLEEDADMTFCLTNSVQNGKITPYEEKNLYDLVKNRNIRWFFFRGSESVRTGTIRTLFRRTVFQDLRYDEELSYSEDFIYMLECMTRTRKCALVEENLYYNVNYHNVPFLFAKKYGGRYHFWESAMLFAQKAEKYIKEFGCDDIDNVPAFDGLILLINATVGIEKHWWRGIRNLCSTQYWRNANNKRGYKQYLRVVKSCGAPTKIKAFLVRHKMYFAYGIMAKLYARLIG